MYKQLIKAIQYIRNLIIVNFKFFFINKDKSNKRDLIFLKQINELNINFNRIT